ncbi:hypothetical protein ACJX0J_024759 [Zea mays]
MIDSLGFFLGLTFKETIYVRTKTVTDQPKHTMLDQRFAPNSNTLYTNIKMMWHKKSQNWAIFLLIRVVNLLVLYIGFLFLVGFTYSNWHILLQHKVVEIY